VEKQGRKPWTLREFGGKTLWDWMGLLIVPVVLSLITVVFAWQQAAGSGKVQMVTLWESEQAMNQSEQDAEHLRSATARAAGGEVAGVERYEVVLLHTS
jgi:ABC-type microcin C transport system permease subunit YejB